MLHVTRAEYEACGGVLRFLFANRPFETDLSGRELLLQRVNWIPPRVVLVLNDHPVGMALPPLPVLPGCDPQDLGEVGPLPVAGLETALRVIARNCGDPEGLVSGFTFRSEAREGVLTSSSAADELRGAHPLVSGAPFCTDYWEDFGGSLAVYTGLFAGRRGRFLVK